MKRILVNGYQEGYRVSIVQEDQTLQVISKCCLGELGWKEDRSDGTYAAVCKICGAQVSRKDTLPWVTQLKLEESGGVKEYAVQIWTAMWLNIKMTDVTVKYE